MLSVLLVLVLSRLPSCSACQYSIIDLLALRDHESLSGCLDEARFADNPEGFSFLPRDGSWDEDDRKALRDSSACLIDRLGKEEYQILVKAAVDNKPYMDRRSIRGNEVVLDREFLEHLERAGRSEEDRESPDSADGGRRDGGGTTESVKEPDTRF